MFLANKAAYTIHHRQEWDEDETFRPRGCFNLAPLSTTSPPNLSSSPNLARLVFTQPAGKAYAHLTHTLHYIAETNTHLQIRTRHACHNKKSHTPPTSPTKVWLGVVCVRMVEYLFLLFTEKSGRGDL